MYAEKYESINFLVGVNGSGKSRYLNKIAKKYNSYKYNVLAISNTVFDKIDSKYSKKISANRGRYMLKKTFIESLLSDDKSIRAYDILNYLGFNREVKILFKFPKVICKRNLYNYLVEQLNSRNKSLIKKYYDIHEIDEMSNIFLDQMDDQGEGRFYLSLSDFDVRNKTKYNYFLDKILSFKLPSNIVKVDVFLSKNNDEFSLNATSSGEAHFISNMLFLVNNLVDHKTNIILIDEPEISLHPKWQREYVLKIYDYFYKHDIKLFIATHSPLIISKVQVANKDIYQDYIQKVKYNIFKVEHEKLQSVQDDEDYSIESLYWEVFGVLTPDNSFLSRYCVQLLDKFDLKKITYAEIKLEFQRMKEACDLTLQRQVLTDIEERFVIRNEN